MANTAVPQGASVAVIGAGIIGVSSAYELARQGYEVTIYDPEPPGKAGPSLANAGHVAASDIYPLSAPGIHWKALNMLSHRDSPLRVPVADAIKQIPWFWRFWQTSQKHKFETATQALTYLCSRTLADTKAMLNAAGLGDMLETNGCAFLYDTQKSYLASQAGWQGKAKAGFDSDNKASQWIADALPDVADGIQHAVLSNQWAMVTEPIDVLRGLVAASKTLGVTFHQYPVTGLQEIDSGVILEATMGSHQYQAVVVAAGVNSATFGQSCGDFIPMAAERGYNLTAPDHGIDLDLPLVFADRGVVATRMTSGLRIGGWAEYANPNRPPNQNYFKAMARISKELFPNINLDGASFWMGNRPSLPDSVPIISRSACASRVFYNCGHGHYGLTHAATSAQILAELVSCSSAKDQYQAYSIKRFLPK